MLKLLSPALVASLVVTAAPHAAAETGAPVTVDNFARAETHYYMSRFVADGAFGQFTHARQMVDVNEQIVVGTNFDALNSFVVLDLSAPATIYMPDPGDRFQSLMCINEEHSIKPTMYGPGAFTLTQDGYGSRYVVCFMRTFADPRVPADLLAANALQDSVRVEQVSKGSFDVPNWDTESLDSVRFHLSELAKTKGSLRDFFGEKENLEPLNHLMGTALGWGGNPPQAAVYDLVIPEQNDGTTAHVLNIPTEVPLDSFWSITVYDQMQFVKPNDEHVYSFNSTTAEPNPDGSYTITFGGDGVNNFPIFPGWQYAVRMYRPHQELIDGIWRFPEAAPAR